MRAWAHFLRERPNITRLAKDPQSLLFPHDLVHLYYQAEDGWSIGGVEEYPPGWVIWVVFFWVGEAVDGASQQSAAELTGLEDQGSIVADLEDRLAIGGGDGEIELAEIALVGGAVEAEDALLVWRGERT